ncbi:radical SAM protein [Vibrio sp. PP-XX7]
MHTCLDTNGYVRKHTTVIDEVLEATDLVMLDIKHMNDDIHQNLIGVSNRRTLDFAHYLHKVGQETWIRYVIEPGYTDDDTSAHLLGEFIQKQWIILKKLSYSLTELGAHKWEAMGLDFVQL